MYYMQLPQKILLVLSFTLTQMGSKLRLVTLVANNNK